MNYKLLKNQQGSILLYSLIVISIISAISIIVSIIVVNQIKLTSGAANGTQAYYAAEAGIEKGLFAVRSMRDDPDFYLEEPLELNYSAINIIKGYSDSSFVNKASFDISQAAAVTPKIENQEIKENESVQIDYYDVDDPLRVDPLTPEVVSLTIQNSGDNPASWAEVSWTAWDNQGELLTSTSARRVIGPSDLSRVNGWPINDLDVFEDDAVGYRVRIKALKAIPTDTEPGDLSSVTVTPYDGDGDEIFDLPSQVVIKSIGERGGFKQSLVASVPWKLPLFGLYDYVLFSESDIYKDIILNAPTYSSGVIQVEADIQGLFGTCESCSACESFGWNGLDCPLQPLGADIRCADQSSFGAICKLAADNSDNALGFILPVPDNVPEGDEYYVSIKATYFGCDEVPAIDCGRDIAVEINGQSVVVSDQVPSGDQTDHICTIPISFSLGDPTLPEDDSSRTIKFTVHPYGSATGTSGVDPGEWHDSEYVLADWYQLSTYKMFDDCY
ncbi:MAG: hypothetical protein ACNFW9_00265 [Candidatus Kerfeldbacteria bacterium]